MTLYEFRRKKLNLDRRFEEVGLEVGEDDEGW